jgi:hypothetical protein
LNPRGQANADNTFIARNDKKIQDRSANYIEISEEVATITDSEGNSRNVLGHGGNGLVRISRSNIVTKVGKHESGHGFFGLRHGRGLMNASALLGGERLNKSNIKFIIRNAFGLERNAIAKGHIQDEIGGSDGDFTEGKVVRNKTK